MNPPLAILASPVHWLPAEASRSAGEVDALFLGLVALSVLLVVVLAGLNLTFILRYRKGSKAARPPLRIASWKLETLWISTTTVIFLGIFAWGAPHYIAAARPPATTYDIHVTARQWMWDIRQPNGRREFNSIHVPSGRAVRLIMESEDVIHSFYVPSFRLKQDVVPGKQVTLWFEPTKPGTYHLFCAEFCGTQHAAMGGSVIVQSPADYEAWLQRGDAAIDTVARGRRLFTLHGCAGCHAAESRFHAPQLEGIYGRQVPLDDGRFVIANEQYLRDAVLDPQREIAAGYEPVMPSYRGQLNEADLLDLLAYLRSLADAPLPPPEMPPAVHPQP